MTSKLSWKPGGNWNFQILWDCQVNWRNSWTHPAGSCNGNTRPEVYYTTQSALPYESTNHISHASQYATQQNSNFKKMPWLLSGKLFQMLHPQTEKGCIIVEWISVPPPKKKITAGLLPSIYLPQTTQPSKYVGDIYIMLTNHRCRRGCCSRWHAHLAKHFWLHGIQNNCQTRNRKHRRAAAKPAACAKPLMLSTPGSKGKRRGRVR